MRALCLAMALGVAVPAAAQDRTQTLADIRQELTVLWVEVQRLNTELSTTGGVTTTGGSGNVQARQDAIELELRRLSAQAEDLQLRIDAIVRDGTNRIGQLEFRLCELEADCDIASLGQTPTLGGGALPSVDAGTVPSSGQSPGAGTDQTLAVAEQSDFDRAQAAFDAGEYASAEALFGAFTETYPGGPLSAEAHYLRGEAAAAQGNWSVAARAYLDSFSGAPDAVRAPDSLQRLGVALGELGQIEEACLTLAEVEARYPGTAAVTDAQRSMAGLRCN